MKIDPQWRLIVRHAWSMKLVILTTISGTITALAPLFKQDSSAYAVLTTILAVCTALSRLIIQPAFRAELKQAQESIDHIP